MASIKGVLTMTVGHNRMDNQERGGWCLAENFDPNRPNPLISTQSSYDVQVRRDLSDGSAAIDWYSIVSVHLELNPRTLQNRKTGENFAVQCKIKDASPSDVLGHPKWFHSMPTGADQPIPSTGRVGVKLIDSLTSNLLFTKAERSDEGTYKCIAQTTGGNVLAQSIDLKLYEKIQFFDTPITQHPRDGSDAVIVCHVKADPPASILWYRNDQLITEENERNYKLLNGNSELLIPTFSVERDNGIYRCEALQEETGDFQSLEITVEAYVKPEITFISPLMEVFEKSQAHLLCTATGTPTPEISWLKDGHRIASDKKYEINSQSGEMVINDVDSEDAGIYTCQAENSVESTTETVNLNVFLMPKVAPMSDVKVKKGDNMELVCKFSGGKPMSVVWKHNDMIFEEPVDGFESNLPERYAVHAQEDSLTLHVFQLELNDSGVFECVATNKAGSTSASLTVNPPIITKSNEGIVRAVNGQEVTLFCEASAVPPPTWTWLSSSGSELFTDETKYFVNTSVNQLNYGRYACKADNGVGETALQPIDVVQIRQPPKPELMFENQHPNYASILIPNYAGLDAKEQPLLVVFEVVKESNFVENDFNWDSSDVVQTDMTFVHAKNEAGSSEYAEASYETVKPRIPEAPTFKPFPDGNQCSPANCLIEWDEPNDGGSDILGYDVQYQSLGNLDGQSTTPVDENRWLVADTVPPTEKFIILRNLDPTSAYIVRIKARNDEGDSNWEQTFFETTAETWTSTPSITAGGIVAIVFFVLLIIFIIVDVSCYYINHCGLLMCVCVNLCGKTPPDVKAKEIALEEGQISSDEKKPLKDALQNQAGDRNDVMEETLMYGHKNEEKKNTNNNNNSDKYNCILFFTIYYYTEAFFYGKRFYIIQLFLYDFSNAFCVTPSSLFPVSKCHVQCHHDAL
ncbi:Neural cell adhesion molecule 1 [Trichinella nelsoni]|uniref:Neural cell adhesion molecule 1 n=1 Tax=Trichinella nelsoni TaxID=6336 RepID=A0A0V0RQL7_9BILA|nr:Neural cell adhesion molecule 1 [Trichinella nelsoni]